MFVHHLGNPAYHPLWVFLGGLLALLMFAILVDLLVWAVLRFTGHDTAGVARRGWTGAADRPDTALEHARYRYARGDIGRDEFFRISRDLGAAVPAESPPTAASAERGPEPTASEEPGR
jgi:uncharacterized membrane protein